MQAVPFDIQRRVVAHKTVESWETVPHAGIIIELDVTPVNEFIRRLRNMPEYADVHLTLNSVMLKIIAESIKDSPDMNAHIEYHKKNNTGLVYYKESMDIAIPMMSHDHRMITPVLRDVGGKSLRGVCEAMTALKNRAENTDIDLLLYEAGLDDTWKRLRRGELRYVLRRFWSNLAGKYRISLPSRQERKRYFQTPASERLVAEDLLDASMVVSNVGSVMPELRCHVSLLEIIAPEITAIALAGVRKQPVVRTDENGVEQVVVREIMPFTFYFDHRALDFAHLTDFLKNLLRLCENPSELL
ncbi:MAG TPA: hypothetical protein ENN29_05260 [Candidatus Hydrogenedentes bacterium]|nr:hypothetical protein [Candidatus Hydrogenedentota bacterium]